MSKQIQYEVYVTRSLKEHQYQIWPKNALLVFDPDRGEWYDLCDIKPFCNLDSSAQWTLTHLTGRVLAAGEKTFVSVMST